jgi:hypothetical protein
MTDMHSAEALESVRIRLKVLKQAKPGDIIVLDAAGRWLLQQPSSWRSALRKVWAFLSQSPVESQRQAFLKSAKESVKAIINHCNILMKTQLFAKALDATGVISICSMKKLTSTDFNELEVLFQTLQSVCIDLYDGLQGLTNVAKHPSYAEDLTFCSEIQVSIVDPCTQFLEQIFRRVGVFGTRVLPFYGKSQAATATATAATTTTSPSPRAMVCLGSLWPPAGADEKDVTAGSLPRTASVPTLSTSTTLPAATASLAPPATPSASAAAAAAGVRVREDKSRRL